ncbi:hypothetical protein M0R36_11150, partial [bacterium]|nr:hypothetical protein [bacterium]
MEKIKGFFSDIMMFLGPAVIYHSMFIAYHGQLLTATVEVTGGMVLCMGIEKAHTLYKRMRGG